MKTISRFCFGCILALLAIPLLASEQKTALDEYVAKPDASYTFEHVATESQFLYTTFFLSMTSQQWRVDHSGKMGVLTVTRGETLGRWRCEKISPVHNKPAHPRTKLG